MGGTQTSGQSCFWVKWTFDSLDRVKLNTLHHVGGLRPIRWRPQQNKKMYPPQVRDSSSVLPAFHPGQGLSSSLRTQTKHQFCWGLELLSGCMWLELNLVSHPISPAWWPQILGFQIPWWSKTLHHNKVRARAHTHTHISIHTHPLVRFSGDPWYTGMRMHRIVRINSTFAQISSSPASWGNILAPVDRSLYQVRRIIQCGGKRSSGWKHQAVKDITIILQTGRAGPPHLLKAGPVGLSKLGSPNRCVPTFQKH